jgi:hypothetical protein
MIKVTQREFAYAGARAKITELLNQVDAIRKAFPRLDAPVARLVTAAVDGTRVKVRLSAPSTLTKSKSHTITPENRKKMVDGLRRHFRARQRAKADKAVKTTKTKHKIGREPGFHLTPSQRRRLSESMRASHERRKALREEMNRRHAATAEVNS